MQTHPRGLKQILFSLLRILIVLSTLFLGAMLFFQEKLIFYPTLVAKDFKFAFRTPFEERWINFNDFSEQAVIKIHSLLFHASDSKGLILYFHGNAGNLDSWGDVAEELSRKTGMDVWIIDYPGFGESEGAISSEAQLHRVAEALSREAAKTYLLEKTIVYGRSIGSGIAVKLATTFKFRGLILESPYLSLRSLAQLKFPIFPTSLLLRYNFRSDEWLSHVSSPAFMIQGEKDEVIPFAQGKELSALKKDVEFIAVPEGRHNHLGSFSLYWESLNAWLSRLK